MKQKLTITALILALTLAACYAPETHPEPAYVGGGEVTPVEIDVEQEEIEEEPEEEEIPQPREDTFDYKGMIFRGSYHDNSFYVNTRSFGETEEELHFLQLTKEIVTLYLAGDIDELMKHFDNDAYAEEQTVLMEREKEQDMPNTILDERATFRFNHMVFWDDNYYTAMTYYIFFEGYDYPTPILIELYLNDNYKWIIKHISLAI